MFCKHPVYQVSINLLHILQPYVLNWHTLQNSKVRFNFKTLYARYAVFEALESYFFNEPNGGRQNMSYNLFPNDRYGLVNSV